MKSGQHETIGAPIGLHLDYELLTLGELSKLLGQWQALLRCAWREHWRLRYGPEPPPVRVFTSSISTGNSIDVTSDFAMALSLITAVVGPPIDWPRRGREAFEFISHRLQRQQKVENDRLYMELGDQPVLDFPTHITESDETTERLVRIINAAKTGNIRMTADRRTTEWSGQTDIADSLLVRVPLPRPLRRVVSNDEEIETGFHEQMLRIYREATTIGYRPTYFLQMVSERGGLGAARQLLHTPEPSSGFTRLWELGRLDLSVEAVVLRLPWYELFTHEELTIARQRLAEYEYYP